MKNGNSTFCGGEPAWANACVGYNGLSSYVEYSLGFSKAANLIIDKVLSSRGISFKADDMVYPVCFNMRHSVELRLKGAIEELTVIAKIKGINLTFDLVGSHDIGNIWHFFKVQSEIIDSRYFEINERIAPTLLDIAEIDATGQTFRYPTDKDKKKHLTDVGLISFKVLKIKFGALEKELDNLLHLTNFLTEEYSLGTFTKKLSRQQLFLLADELPNYSLWREKKFKEIKITVQKQFSLSGNELARAIDLIRSNYELSFKIGDRLPLKGLDEKTIFWFLELWVQLNLEAIKRQHNPDLFGLDIDSVFQSQIREEEIKDSFLKKSRSYLTVERLAGLNAIFHFAEDIKFSERYIRIYERELNKSSMHIINENNFLWNDLMRLADKANFLKNLFISLRFLNYDDLAEKIMRKYSVANT